MMEHKITNKIIITNENNHNGKYIFHFLYFSYFVSFPQRKNTKNLREKCTTLSD